MRSDDRQRHKRKVPRFQCKDVLVSYHKKRSKLASLFNLEAPKSSPLPLRDISRDGLCFLAKEKLRAGQHLIFSIRFNRREHRIQVEGKILWVKSGEGHYPYRIGVGFVHMSPETWRFLSHMESHCRRKEDDWQSWTFHGHEAS